VKKGAILAANLYDDRMISGKQDYVKVLIFAFCSSLLNDLVMNNKKKQPSLTGFFRPTIILTGTRQLGEKGSSFFCMGSSHESFLDS
jgi:hypothetical protein